MLAKYPEGSEIREPDSEASEGTVHVFDALSVRPLTTAGGLGPTRDAGRAIALNSGGWSRKTKSMLRRLAALPIVPVAHHVIQTLDVYRDEEPDFAFALIAQCIRSVDPAGYADDQIAATTVVKSSTPTLRIIRRFLFP